MGSNPEQLGFNKQIFGGIMEYYMGFWLCTASFFERFDIVKYSNLAKTFLTSSEAIHWTWFISRHPHTDNYDPWTKMHPR